MSGGFWKVGKGVGGEERDVLSDDGGDGEEGGDGAEGVGGD